MLLHHKFIQIAKQHSDSLAFIDRSTGRNIEYSRALIASLILSRKLRREKRTFLGIMLPTSAGAGLSIIGTLMAGKIPVMINYSTGAKKNAEFAQKKCDFDTIITSKKLLEKIECPQIPGMVFLEDIMEKISAFEKIWAALKSKLPAGLIKKLVKGKDPEETSVILFTSGSEKEPKAVQLSHNNIYANIEGFSQLLELDPNFKELCILPFFHVFGLTTNLWTPICHGMTLVTYANPLEFKTIAKIIREEKISMMVGTPAFFWGYVLKSRDGDYKSIKYAVCGADKCPDSLRQTFRKKHSIEILEGYGATETSPVVSVNEPATNRPGSIGRPLPNIEVKTQNFETGIDCKPGEMGKILVKGPTVMKGYYDDLEETSLRIRDGWYDTGDMGYLDEDGFLWHCGRLKRFVKIGGEMVSLVAVEEALNKHLPEGAECCVVELPDPSKGAKIVAAANVKLNRKHLQEKLSEHLPNIALPKEYIKLEELPKMGSGKVDFRTTTEIVRKILHSQQAKVMRNE